MGGRLSKSRADKYIHKLFEEHWNKNQINPKDFKPKKDGSVPPTTYIMNGQLTINYGQMRNSHKEVTIRQIKKYNIKSASELIAKASVGIPKHVPKVAMNLTMKQEKEYFRLQGIDEAEKDLNLIGALQESEWKLYKSLLPYYTKGMNYVVYQIRVYGVNKKNQSKFDKLYKDVVSFFLLIDGHHRRYFKEDLDKLSNEYLRAKTHLAKAIEVIEDDKSKSAVYSMKYGVGRGRIFSIKVVAELYRQIAVMEKLVNLNDEEKTIKSRVPNETEDLQYFYYLCWELYKLVDDSKFKTPKYNNQKLFAEFVYHIQSRFTSVGSLSKTSESIRKKPKFKKMKFLNLQSIKTEVTYNKIFKQLFGN